MTDYPKPTVVGTITGKTLWMMRRHPDGTITIPVDAKDAFDESSVVQIYLGDAPALIGNATDLLNAHLANEQQEREDYADAVRGGVEQAARDAGMGLK